MGRREGEDTMKTMTRTAAWALSGAVLLATAVPALAADTTLTIESWRNDDLPIWQEKIIPAFERGPSRHQAQVPADRAQGV